MTNENTIVLAALANTGEAQRNAFAELLAAEPGVELLAALQNDMEDLPPIEVFENYRHESGADASDILGTINDALEAARGIVHSLTALQEAYVDKMGIPAAVEEVAHNLQSERDGISALALTYGLELMSLSDRRLPRHLLDGLVSLGMPKTISGRAVNTYSRAALGGWTRKLLEDVSGATEASKQLRAMQGTAANMQEAIDGTLALIGAKRDATGKVVSENETL